MSKRIANTRAVTARNGRVRYGWRVKKLKTDLEKVDEQLQMQDLDEKLRVKYENFKQRAISILPKKLLQRHQGR